MSSALRTFLMAIRILHEINVNFMGILWYQAENDASLAEGEAQSYGHRFDTFLSELNGLLEFAIYKLRCQHKKINLPFKMNFDNTVAVK